MNKKMTAFRFAKLHNIPIVSVPKRKQISSVAETINITLTLDDYSANFNSVVQQTISHLEKANIDNFGCIAYTEKGDFTIGLTRFKSQSYKNLVMWHELGHYIDRRQMGYSRYTRMAILKAEARASALAIKLMKKYDQWKDEYLNEILDWYQKYENEYTWLTPSYRHLILKEV